MTWLQTLVIGAAVALPVASSCSETKKSTEATDQGEAANPLAQAAEASTPLRDAFAALPVAPPLFPPLEYQLGSSYLKTEFLGFTEDYRAYAVRIEHDFLFGEEQGAFTLHMHQVFDTWTGDGIAAYEIKVADRRGDSFEEDEYHESLKRFSEQLEPDSAWKTWLAETPLIKAKARRKTSLGEFGLKVVGRVPLRSKLNVKPTPFGFRVNWSKLPTGEAYEAAKSRKRKVPRLVTSWIPTGHEALPSVAFRPEMAWVNWSGAPETGRTHMLVKAYPTADERRVLWLIQPAPDKGDKEPNDPMGRIFMRAYGRQIKVVHAGSGVDHARRAASHLEGSGMTVTAISKQAKESQESGIYYRGENREIAEAVQRLLPGELPIEELKAKGWVDVIIVLGRDAAPATKAITLGKNVDLTTAMAAVSPAQLTALVEPATAATDNCPTIVLRATEGKKTLDEVRLQDECEDAPDYICEDDGQGCLTTTYEIGRQVTVAGRPYVWITTTESNESDITGTTSLYGYGCGTISAAWKFTSEEHGSFFGVDLKESKDGTELGATISENRAASNGARSKALTEHLQWRPGSCVFVPAK